MNVKNLRVIAASLCLSATLLTGCCHDKEIDFGDSTVNYENEVPSGAINYKDLSNCGKIVTLEDNLVKTHRLMMKVITKGGGGRTPVYNIIKYIDLESGAILIEYYDQEEIIWVVGANLTITEELDITSYLLQNDFIKREYEVQEIFTFFEEKIKPTLGSNEKELVK